MTPDWSPLEDELSRWQKAGLILPLWWRDDDAVQVTPELDRLTMLSERLNMPVHIAVIPEPAEWALAEMVERRPALIPVVHGWAHRNHAPSGEKKAEFQLHRPMPAILSEARQGLARLRDLFGPALRPMFVPPWNRIAPEIVEELPGLGYRVVSTATPRKRAEPVAGLCQINTHLDPIDWRGSRSLLDPQRLIAQVTDQLGDRREGRADNDEPYGILTHHLVHDAAIWAFTEALLSRLMNGPARPWIMEKDEEKQ
ncbi:polysaccharide deacetylase family protein [Ruegeria aquimaris]|uniref:Polysaccharide deacetylase family protein n=1 Tax=Ruegeria aquimaris TaxID=2984333 RepID=A0ABT3AIG9_9RHOB|nr:polysaccharide deacetylase family protein [Ruegeria sp. XHP0148]MCV2888448.1 polysaccharide deacetylase family protein [Ruegeria sp. XHP0148]